MSAYKEVVRFLAVLGLSEYVPVFEKQKLQTMTDLKNLTNGDLKDMGVVKIKDRKRIMDEVDAFFALESKEIDQGVLEWNISGALMQQFKSAQYKKTFYTPRFKAVGGEWQLAICPNGYQTEGIALLRIWCKTIESEEVNVCYYVDSTSLEYSQMDCDGKHITKAQCIDFDPPFRHEDIQE
eukprot:412900_1